MNRPVNALLDAAAGALTRHAALQGPVLVAVSGGADSVCLAHLLQRLEVPLATAHLNHGLRGLESRADAAFVRDLAADLGVPHFEEEADTATAMEAGESLELAARRLRYGFLRRTAAREGYPWVATGHHADDQAETVLMRVVRGTSPHGLAGIPEVRELTSGTGPRVRVIRPLLEVGRDAIRAFLADAGIGFRHDATNDDPTIPRNRMRHELLPALESAWNPRLRDALTRLAALQRGEDAFLEHATGEAWTACVEEAPAGGLRIERTRFGALHPALRQRLLSAAVSRLGAEPAFDLLTAGADCIARGRLGERADLGAGVTLENGRDWANLLPEGAPPRDAREHQLKVPGAVEGFGRRFTARWLEHAPENPRAWCSPARQVLDATGAAPPYTVRTRRPGDRFRPLGLDGSTKLKNYLGGLGLPPSERESLPLLFSGDTLVWVVGHAVDAGAAVTRDTGRCVAVEVTRADL
jgi:tRNA(Ile)-lysidine synthase